MAGPFDIGGRGWGTRCSRRFRFALVFLAGGSKSPSGVADKGTILCGGHVLWPSSPPQTKVGTFLTASRLSLSKISSSDKPSSRSLHQVSFNHTKRRPSLYHATNPRVPRPVRPETQNVALPTRKSAQSWPPFVGTWRENRGALFSSDRAKSCRTNRNTGGLDTEHSTTVSSSSGKSF